MKDRYCYWHQLSKLWGTNLAFSVSNVAMDWFLGGAGQAWAGHVIEWVVLAWMSWESNMI